MKKYLVMVCAMLGAVAFSEPGFVAADLVTINPTLPEQIDPEDYDINQTYDIWANPTGVVLSAYCASSGSCPSSDYLSIRSCAYGAYMYFEGGKTYFFRAKFEDHASVKVRDIMLIPQTKSNESVTNSITFFNSGWHKLELRFLTVTKSLTPSPTPSPPRL